MIYTPSEDTFLLAECIRRYRGSRALEIGVGAGLLLKVLEKNFDLVAGSDVDIEAIRHCAGRTGAMVVCCDAASAFSPSAKFDLIVSNPPYLPDDGKILDSAVNGGPKGIEKTIHFVVSAFPLLAVGGRMLIVVSSLADPGDLDRLVVDSKFHKKVIREKTLFYETLYVIELSR
ncbi:MAG: HemK2/MTQ2 family protein methyltransferase [Nitrososphaera sp.]